MNRHKLFEIVKMISTIAQFDAKIKNYKIPDDIMGDADLIEVYDSEYHACKS